MQLSFDAAKRREAGQRLAQQPGREVKVAAKSGKRGPITVEDLAPRIDHALRNIDNRIELNRSPLLRLAAVERLAEARFADCIHPGAVALRQILRQAVSETLREMEDDPALLRMRQFLELYAAGASVTAASEHLGLSREHCSRVLKRRAVRLVAEKFSRLAHCRRGVPVRLLAC